MLSIVIPTLNEEEYLPKLLKSIEEQDFDNYEVIVADANSKDKTRQVAERFNCKVVEGGMLPKGRNRGAEAARGDILLFLDADKLLPPGFLRKVLEVFQRRDLDMATFPVKFYDGGKFINFLVDPLWNYVGYISKGIFPFTLGAILVNKEVHERINGFNEEIIEIGEDNWYARQINREGKTSFIHSVKLLDSVRRLEQDGYVKTYLKYILAALYMFLFGPIKSDLFNYKYDHYES